MNSERRGALCTATGVDSRKENEGSAAMDEDEDEGEEDDGSSALAGRLTCPVG